MINQEIIERYLRGEANEEELKLLKAYLQGKDLSLLYEFMQYDWSDTRTGAEEFPQDLSAEMLQNIKQTLSNKKVIRLKRRSKRRSWLVAASVLLVLSLGIWPVLDQTESMHIYTTKFGEWKTLQLPDSSWVKLNAHSTLTCKKNWMEGDDRQVWLEGEAFFEVKKKPSTGAKFQVITKDLQVEVLGTAFNVNSRGSQTDVFLEEGQIKLSMDDQEELLQPGDFIAYSKAQKNVLERRNEATPELHTSWKDGVLILKDRSGAEILKKIEEIYGVRIQVGNKALLTNTKTIAVPMDLLQVALPVLEKTFEAKITQQADQLIIR